MLSHSTYHAYRVRTRQRYRKCCLIVLIMLIEYKTEIQKMLSHSTYHAYRVQDRDTENVVS